MQKHYYIAPYPNFVNQNVSLYGLNDKASGFFSIRRKPQALRKQKQLHQIKAVEVHHLFPGGDEVFDKLFVAVGTGVNLCQCAEL